MSDGGEDSWDVQRCLQVEWRRQPKFPEGVRKDLVIEGAASFQTSSRLLWYKLRCGEQGWQHPAAVGGILASLAKENVLKTVLAAQVNRASDPTCGTSWRSYNVKTEITKVNVEHLHIHTVNAYLKTEAIHILHRLIGGAVCFELIFWFDWNQQRRSCNWRLSKR